MKKETWVMWKTNRGEGGIAKVDTIREEQETIENCKEDEEVFSIEVLKVTIMGEQIVINSFEKCI